jgi:hypothetical protein
MHARQIALSFILGMYVLAEPASAGKMPNHFASLFFHAVDEIIVYVNGSDSSLWREVNNMKSRYLVDQTVRAFQGDGFLTYVLGFDNNLWREFGSSSSRELVDGHVSWFQALDESFVYVQAGGPDLTLWREYKNQGNRERVDGNVA